MEHTILITGGAGFIGSNLTKLFVTKYPKYKIINLDKLTYAGNMENLRDIENDINYSFIRGDITDLAFLKKLFDSHHFTAVLHCAAESHVDRSISDPLAFVHTNIVGTAALLQCAKDLWQQDYSGKLFYHISTDEVYGSLGESGFFEEKTAYDPRSPYSASKASSDHLVRAFYHTYHLPVIISNCSNNYGPFQFPEKLIPLCIFNIIKSRPLPIYGKGLNIRDWLYVEDHAKAIDKIFHEGKIGETYNIGGHNEWTNIDIVYELCRQMDNKLDRTVNTSAKLITFVKDRAGHDLRYAIDASKLENELGWTPSLQFEEGLSKTIDWYLANSEWLNHVTSGDYMNYYEQQYQKR
jgi:dTDP-glucose 4,6-dehydratase